MEDRIHKAVEEKKPHNDDRHYDVIPGTRADLPPIQNPFRKPKMYTRVERRTQTEPPAGKISPTSDDTHTNHMFRCPSPRRKKPIEPPAGSNHKKHCCSLFDGPPSKPAPRLAPRTFFHPGIATLERNRLEEVLKKTTTLVTRNQTKKAPRTQAFWVPVGKGQGFDFRRDTDSGDVRTKQKNHWQRRLSPIPPIKKPACGGDPKVKMKKLHNREDTHIGKRQEDHRPTPISHQEEKDPTHAINEITERSEPQNTNIKKVSTETPEVAEAQQADETGNENGIMTPIIEVDSVSKMEGDARILSTEDAKGQESESPVGLKVYGSIEKMMMETPVSHVSFDSSCVKVAEEDLHLQESSSSRQNEDCTDEVTTSENTRVRSVSVGVQTGEELLFEMKFSDKPSVGLEDSKRLSNGEYPDRDCRTSSTAKDLETVAFDRCAENELRRDEFSHRESVVGEQPVQSYSASSLHEATSKGTMTPTAEEWETMGIEVDSEAPCEEKIDGPHPDHLETNDEHSSHQSISYYYACREMHDAQDENDGTDVAEVPSPHPQRPGSGHDLAPPRLSGEDENLVIEDSGGDNLTTSPTKSQVSINTIGQGDQLRAVTSSPVANGSSQPGSSSEGFSEVIEDQPGKHVVTNPSSERPETFGDNADVQGLIDNLIAARVGPITECSVKRSTLAHGDPNTPPRISKSEETFLSSLSLFTLTNEEITDHRFDSLGNHIPFSVNHSALRLQAMARSKSAQPDGGAIYPPVIEDDVEVRCQNRPDETLDEDQKRDISHAFVAMEDAVAAARLIIRYLGMTDSRLRAALHRAGPNDDAAQTCLAADSVAREAEAMARRTQSVFMTYYKLAAAEDTFREFILKEVPGSAKERRQLRRWQVDCQSAFDESDDSEDSET